MPAMSPHAQQLRTVLTDNELDIFLYQVWKAVLVPLGQAPDDTDTLYSFICEHTCTTYPATEWRFQGVFGFGGKFWLRPDLSCYVNYYPENKTAALDLLQAEINQKLKEITAHAITTSSLR